MGTKSSGLRRRPTQLYVQRRMDRLIRRAEIPMPRASRRNQSPVLSESHRAHLVTPPGSAQPSIAGSVQCVSLRLPNAAQPHCSEPQHMASPPTLADSTDRAGQSVRTPLADWIRQQKDHSFGLTAPRTFASAGFEIVAWPNSPPSGERY